MMNLGVPCLGCRHAAFWLLHCLQFLVLELRVILQPLFVHPIHSISRYYCVRVHVECMAGHPVPKTQYV